MKINISEGDHLIYYFQDKLCPVEETYEISECFFKRLEAVEKEFWDCQNILKTLYEEREVQNEKEK